MTTIFYGLYQGDYADHEGDATCLAVFSTPDRAKNFEDLLSKQHTELKREANEIVSRIKRGERGLQEFFVADLYWDIRPLPFDPENEEEL